MHCPQCDDTTMQRRDTSDGAEIDACPGCGAAWLDRGEIFFFVHDRRRFADAIDDARKVIPDGLIFLLEPQELEPQELEAVRSAAAMARAAREGGLRPRDRADRPEAR